LGISAYVRGELDLAESYFQKGLAIFEELGDKFGITTSLNTLGTGALYSGQYAKAKDYYERCLMLEISVGGTTGEANGLNNLGLTLIWLNELERVPAMLTRAMNQSREIGDLTLVLELIVGFAHLHLKLGNITKSAELAGFAEVQPATIAETHNYRLKPLYKMLKESLPNDEYQNALERGKSLDLDHVVEDLLAEFSPL
jgi:tetratricopeptide (TPR) repeat protein